MTSSAPRDPTARAASSALAGAGSATRTVTAHQAQLQTVGAPRHAPAEVTEQASTVAHDVLATAPRRRPSLLAAAIVGFLVLGIALVLVVGYFLLALGPSLAFIGGLLALIPLTIVVLGVRWVDRWEPEPRLALLLAFLWGATVSILIALFVDVAASDVIAASGGDTGLTEFFQAVVQAPIVEEFAKGFGLLIIYLVARRYFDGPVDGIVYAAMIAAGFAFTENIQYFGLQLFESGAADGALIEIFFIRGILAPFSHVMFTACIGFAIGLAARTGTALGGIGAFLLGVIPAVLLHAFWNGALFFVYDFYGYYVLVQVPMFAVAVGIVLYLRDREQKMTRLRLGEYAAAGWFNADEVTTLGTSQGRRQALAWARPRGLGAVMKAYIRDATLLAFARNRIVSGRDRIGSQHDEALLLQRVTASRRALMAATPAGRRGP